MAIPFACTPCRMCLALQFFIALVLAEKGVCMPLADGTSSSSESCLLQRQTSVAKSGAVVEMEVSAQTAHSKDEQMTESGSASVADGVKKNHHHHHKRAEKEKVPSTTDEWADYLVDGTTTTSGAPKTDEDKSVSGESEPSFMWKLFCWFDFLHWFCPASTDEAAADVPNASNETAVDNASNVTNGTEADETSNETEPSNKTELNDTNSTKEPHAPLPASLQETKAQRKAQHSKASKKRKKKHGPHKSA